MDNYIEVTFRKDGKVAGTVKLDSVQKYSDFKWMYWTYGFVLSDIKSFFAMYPSLVESNLTDVMGRLVQCVFNSAELVKASHGLPIKPGKGWEETNGKYYRIDADAMEVAYHHNLDPDPQSADIDSEIVSPRHGRPCFGLVMKSNHYCQVDDLIPDSYEYDPSPAREWRVVSYHRGFKLSTYGAIGKLMFIFVSGVRPTNSLTPSQGFIRLLEVDVTPGNFNPALRMADMDTRISFEKEKQNPVIERAGSPP